MNTEFPYNKGGDTLDGVINGIFDNLKHKHEESGEEVVTLARTGFKEICEHLAEWQSKHTTNNTAQYMDNEVKK